MVKVISWSWPKVVYIQNFKLDFLRNSCADLKQILYESFQVHGTDDMMLVTFMVKALQKSTSPEPAGRFPLNLICSIRDSSPS